MNLCRLLGLSLLIVGCAELERGADAGPIDPTFAVSYASGRFLAVHLEHPWVAFEVDVDDVSDTDHVMGITPIIHGRRLEGASAIPDVRPMFTPTFDAGPIVDARVTAAEALEVEYVGPPFSALGGAADDDEPILMRATFLLDDNLDLHVTLSGLYYVRPSALDASVVIHHAAGESTLDVTPETGGFVRYIDDVFRVEVSDAWYGDFTLDTDVRRLQIENKPSGWDIFELDFDHAFKDRGQKSVATELVMPLGDRAPN